jgi:hypothetical protein
VPDRAQARTGLLEGLEEVHLLLFSGPTAVELASEPGRRTDIGLAATATVELTAPTGRRRLFNDFRIPPSRWTSLPSDVRPHGGVGGGVLGGRDPVVSSARLRSLTCSDNPEKIKNSSRAGQCETGAHASVCYCESNRTSNRTLTTRRSSRPAGGTPRNALTTANVMGAGDGNRTRVASLEDWGSTIELRPRGPLTGRGHRIRCPLTPESRQGSTSPGLPVVRPSVYVAALLNR